MAVVGWEELSHQLIAVLKRREALMYSWPWCLGWVAFKIQPGGSFANFRDV